MGVKTVSFGRFLCSFNIMDCLEPLHMTGQVIGLCGH